MKKRSFVIIILLITAFVLWGCGGGGGGDSSASTPDPPSTTPGSDPVPDPATPPGTTPGTPPITPPDTPPVTPPDTPPPTGPVADFGGQWQMMGVSAGGTYQGMTWGRLEVDAYGTIYCGLVANDKGSVEMNGGRVYIDVNTGSITGTIITTDGVTRNVLGGRMQANRMYASLLTENELFFLIREGGEFALADFISRWNIFSLGVGAASDGVIHGYMDISSESVIAGSLTHSNSTIYDIVSGSLTLTDLVTNLPTYPGGRLHGALLLNPPYTFHLDGRIGQLKEKGFINAAMESGGISSNYFSLLIKSGGQFNPADLAGNWRFFSAESGGTGGGVSYGMISCDSTGAVISGYQTKGTETLQLTGGMLNLDGNGIINGTITLTDGSVINILSGKLDPEKLMIVGIGQKNPGINKIIIGFKDI